MTDEEVLQKSIELRAIADAAHARLKSTLILSVSLPRGGQAVITALRGPATLGAWTVERGEVAETVAAIIEREQCQS